MTPAGASFVEALKSIQVDEDDPSLTAQLYDLTDTIASDEEKEAVVPIMFEFFETYPDAEHGSPGPFVHFIESVVGYEVELERSIMRRPTPHTVWMINRILNGCSTIEKRKKWMELLSIASGHPQSTELTIQEARGFLEHQNERG